MRLSSFLPLIALPLTFAKSITIGVGEGGLVFKPESVIADVGDVLQFHFYPKNHSVVEGAFSTPCHPLAGGVYSGFFPVTAEGSTIFEVTVNSTDAIYFYCSQIGHCQLGMAMVVNPPSTNDTLAAYKAATNGTKSVSPAAVAGGVFIEATGNSTAPSNTTTTTTPTPSPSGSTTTTPTPSPSASTGGAAGNSFSQCSLLGWAGIAAFALAMI